MGKLGWILLGVGALGAGYMLYKSRRHLKFLSFLVLPTPEKLPGLFKGEEIGYIVGNRMIWR